MNILSGSRFLGNSIVCSGNNGRLIRVVDREDMVCGCWVGVVRVG